MQSERLEILWWGNGQRLIQNELIKQASEAEKQPDL